jgi:aspartyl-tRNA(Asn)/glutamyl-tRNA(Gln) amidotransferase subunit A
MTDLIKLSLAEAAAKLRTKDVSATELTESYLNRIEARNGAINAYITVARDKALAMAKQADAELAAGNAKLLTGVPLGIKDLYCTKDILTTAASHILDGFKPAYESTVTQNLWNQGAVMLGKLNLDEFAMGSSNETSYYGKVNNPWDVTRTPGGSSGGSAAAVADYLCAAATGTDTGGSIRQPAALTGTVGLKPTYGRCSRFGIVAFASSLDQAGPMTRTVEDAALMLQAMAGYDPKDSTSANIPVPAYSQTVKNGSLKGVRIGLPKEYYVEGVQPAIKAHIESLIKKLEAEGAELVEISLPHTNYGIPTYYVIAPAEAASNLARYDGMRFGLRVEGNNLEETYRNTRSAGFGEEVQRRIMIGNYTLSSGYFDAYYLKAQKVRAKIKQDFDAAFTKVDLILTPTTPTPAFKLGAKVDDPVTMYLNDIFTVTANLAGLPGISLPCGTVEEEGVTLPVGAQLIAPAFCEEQLLQSAYQIEQLVDFSPLSPQN